MSHNTANDPGEQRSWAVELEKGVQEMGSQHVGGVMRQEMRQRSLVCLPGTRYRGQLLLRRTPVLNWDCPSVTSLPWPPLVLGFLVSYQPSWLLGNLGRGKGVFTELQGTTGGGEGGSTLVEGDMKG